MKTTLTLKARYLFLIALLMMAETWAQDKNNGEKIIENQVIVLGSPQEVWKTLTAYGNVSWFNSAIDESVMLDGSPDVARVGAEREVLIPDGTYNIINKERIIAYNEGKSYTYQVYESENFHIQNMLVTYGVRLDERGRTVLFSKTAYQLNSKLATRMLKGKLNRVNMDSLLAFKNYIETGERDANPKSLRKRYRQIDDPVNMTDYLVSN